VCNVTTEILPCCYVRCYVHSHILHAISEGLCRRSGCFLLRTVHLLTVYICSLPLDEAKKLPVWTDFQNFVLEVCASNLGPGVCYPDWVSWFLGIFAKFGKATVRLVMSVCLSVCLSVRPSVCQSVHMQQLVMSVCPSVRLSVRPHATTSNVCLSDCPSVCPSACNN
jgi:hypothetical protein